MFSHNDLSLGVTPSQPWVEYHEEVDPSKGGEGAGNLGEESTWG
jgi:hypothetical protein